MTGYISDMRGKIGRDRFIVVGASVFVSTWYMFAGIFRRNCCRRRRRPLSLDGL